MLHTPTEMPLFVLIGVIITALPFTSGTIRVTQNRAFISSSPDYVGRVFGQGILSQMETQRVDHSTISGVQLPLGYMTKLYIQLGSNSELPPIHMVLQIWRPAGSAIGTKKLFTLVWTYTLVEYVSGPLSGNTAPRLLTLHIEGPDVFRTQPGDCIGWGLFGGSDTIWYLNKTKDITLFRHYWHGGIHGHLSLGATYGFDEFSTYEHLIGAKVIPQLIQQITPLYPPTLPPFHSTHEPFTATAITTTATTTIKHKTPVGLSDIHVLTINNHITIIIVIIVAALALIGIIVACYEWRRRRAGVHPQVTEPHTYEIPISETKVHGPIPADLNYEELNTEGDYISVHGSQKVNADGDYISVRGSQKVNADGDYISVRGSQEVNADGDYISVRGSQEVNAVDDYDYIS